ncbi:MAG: BatD family protein [Gammaproteobacteria bacterium]|nr:BatD family protein [Gammaproteobacteria bacterium]
MNMLKIFILASCIYSMHFFASITASIQNEPHNNQNINQNGFASFSTDDLIELVITVEQPTDSQLDISNLTQDFKISSQAKQVSHSIINGQSSSKLQWVIGLQAKKTGVLTIPSISLGSQKTAPITVKITENTVDPNQATDIFMNIEADDQSIYVKAPITITVNIYISTNITARNLELNSPEQSGYTLYKLDEYNKQIFYKNKRYNLFQVKYLGFYNTAGKQFLPMFTVSGVKLKNANKHYDIFSLYQQQWLPFSRTTPEIPLNVLPQPTNFSLTHWLPANKMTLDDTWSFNNQNIPVGEAIQRTVTFSGLNIPAENLPIPFDINTNSSNTQNNYKAYVDKPEYSNNPSSTGLNSTLSQKITYITTQPGQLVFPEQKFVWWNNKTKKAEELNLASKTLNVQGEVLSTQNTSVTPVTPVTPVQTHQINKTDQTNNYNFYTLLYGLLGIIGLLFLVIIYLLWALNDKQKNKLVSNTKPTTQISNIQIKPLLKQLKNTAQNSQTNQEQIYKELVTIADALLISKSTNNIANNNTSINSLGWLKQELPLDNQENINCLLSSVYSNNKENWDKDFFIKKVLPAIENLFQTFQKQKTDSSNLKTLSDLYPK